MILAERNRQQVPSKLGCDTSLCSRMLPRDISFTLALWTTVGLPISSCMGHSTPWLLPAHTTLGKLLAVKVEVQNAVGDLGGWRQAVPTGHMSSHASYAGSIDIINTYRTSTPLDDIV